MEDSQWAGKLPDSHHQGKEAGPEDGVERAERAALVRVLLGNQRHLQNPGTQGH